ncbi:protein localization to plasma membrane [Mactra antiquata]
MAVEFDGERMVKNQQSSNESVHPKKPLCACTAYSCNKLFLFLYSCLYVIVGAGCLLVGVWLEFQTKDLESINKFLFIPVIMLMSVGFVIMINSLFGIAGVIRESTCLLKFFLVITVLSFFTQVTIGVLAFLHRQKVPDLGSDDFMHIIKDYHINNHYKNHMDNLQVSFNCCGFESYMDYEENEIYNCGSTYIQQCGVPWSCCKKDARSGTLKLSCGHETRFNSTMPVEKIYTMGCTDTFISWLGWNLDFVGIVGLGSAIPQIVGILLAYFFVRQVCEMQMWYRVGM